MLRKQEATRVPLIQRAPNEFGVRCGESQADGVPCPGPDCRCDECQRSFMPVPTPTTTKPHA